MTSFVETLSLEKKINAKLFNALAIFSGTLFLALCAQVSIPLWFTPVPLSLQTFGVLLIGALLGSKRSLFSVLLYLIMGACGLPVFAGGGAGLIRILSPTGGYLIGFLISAYLIGVLLEKGFRYSYSKTFFALLLGHLTIYLCGMIGLCFYMDPSKVFKLGVLPFIVGDLFKIVLASLLIPSGWHFINSKV